jgi:heavy metal sensor kinase
MRLTIWYGGVLAVVLAVFGVVIYFTMRHQMLSRIDHGLREEMADVLSEVDRAESREGMLHWLDRRFGQHQGFDFQVSTSDGGRVFVNERLGEQQMPIPSSLVADRDVFESHQRRDAPRWRIVTRRVDGPEGTLVVQIARSLESYDHEMSELLLALLLTGPLTVLVALGGGYFLARRALAPVDRMTETANQIEARQLAQRLEVVNPNDELGRLAETFNGMLDRLEKSFREMQRFTADASHELRTPISVIRSEAEVALNKPVSDHDKRILLSNILEECERLTRITDQLLTLSREDAGIAPFQREPVDVGGLANEIADTMRPLADAKELTLAIAANGTAVVAGDPDRLKQVVYNLLDNAIKYTQTGRVDLAVARAGDNVELTVCDTGVGIGAAHLPHVFERFYRVDKARTRSEGGTGLGLSIVQSVVVAHGGNVKVQSQPNKGTTITVSLPNHPSQKPQPPL